MSDRRAKGMELMPMGVKQTVAVPAGYQAAGSYNRPELVVSSELKQAVLGHIARHYVTALSQLGPPRFLAVMGVPGAGKTLGVRVICSRAGVDLIVVPPSDLAGETEGAPAKALDEVSRAVEDITAREQRLMVVCLDDIDCSNAVRREGTEYTVNQQLTEGYLQALADGNGMTCAYTNDRVPVILTGNDFVEGVRASLLRPGRCRFHAHVVGLDEKIGMVGALFPEVDARAIRAVVRRHADEPVAFFADLRTRLEDGEIDALIEAYGLDVQAIDRVVRERSSIVNAKGLEEAAADAAASKAKRYLDPKEE